MDVKITSTDTPEQVQATLGRFKEKSTRTDKGKSATADTPAPGESQGKTSADSGPADPASGDPQAENQDKSAEPPGGTENGSENGDGEKKAKASLEKKLGRLNKKLADEKRAREYWETEARKNQVKPDPAKASEQKETTTTAKPKSEDFEKHEDFIEALADWKADQKFDQKIAARERDQKARDVKTTEAEREKVYGQKAKQFAEKTPDFQDVLEDVGDIPLSMTLKEAILASDNGPELVYELAKNRDEFKRINSLSPIAAARELGKFEAKVFKPSEPKTEAKEPEVTTSKAPKPINPTGAKASQSKEPNSSDQSYDEWVSRRRAQIRESRGR